MTTSPTTVVRAYAILKGLQAPHIFSDRLRSKSIPKNVVGRSIKVWRFSENDYNLLAEHMHALGYKVNIVKTPTGRTRLHVFYTP